MSIYQDRLQAITNISVTDVLFWNMDLGPDKSSNTKLYDSLKRGVGILDDEDLLMLYMNSYGHKHICKLYRAYSKLPNDFMSNSSINIIDYGCGQALGTICYAEKLKVTNANQWVNSVTLIEPSKPCLERAEFHSKLFSPVSIIHPVNKKFDSLEFNDLYSNQDIPTLHIFSNVLDMNNFDMNRLSDLINRCIKGYNIFVCVAPIYLMSKMNEHVNCLVKKLQGTMIFRESKNLLAYNGFHICTSNIACFVVQR